MTDAVAEAPVETAKSKKIPLILGLVLAILGGAGGFYAVSSGMVGGSADQEEHAAPANQVEALPHVAFVEIEPILISISGGSNVEHLRFRGQLEVEAAYQQDVEHILPRVVDVLNGYLRALDVRELEDSLALSRLRAQMLRRVQMVVGKGRVRDLLIIEFVLN